MLTCIAYYVLKNHLHVYHKFQYRDKSLWIIFITIFIYTHTYYLSYAHRHKIIITIFTRHIRISFDSQDSKENLRKDFNKFLKTKTNALLQHLNEKRKNITPPPPTPPTRKFRGIIPAHDKFRQLITRRRHEWQLIPTWGEGGRGGGVAMKGYKSKMVVCAPPRHEQQPSSSSSSYPLNQGWTYSTEGRVISWLVKRLRGWGEGGGGTALPDILLRPPSCRDTTTAIRIKVRPVQRSRANIFRFPSSRGRGRGRGGTDGIRRRRLWANCPPSQTD